MQTSVAPATPRRKSARGKTEQAESSQIVKTVTEEKLPAKEKGFGAIKVQVEFKLSANGANSVSVAGSFNGWNAKKTPLRKDGDWWTATVELPRGRYEYRFVVDGKWVSDPSAKESATNPFGGDNSVLSL
jgi:1,4-alpha-glucan branching enzyme